MTKLDKKAVAGGRGFGELSEADRAFLKADFDRRLQVGVKGVGMFATAEHPGVAKDDAALEGDDIG